MVPTVPLLTPYVQARHSKGGWPLAPSKPSHSGSFPWQSLAFSHFTMRPLAVRRSTRPGQVPPGFVVSWAACYGCWRTGRRQRRVVRVEGPPGLVEMNILPRYRNRSWLRPSWRSPARGVGVALLAAATLAAGASSASAVVVHLQNGKTLSFQPLRGATTIRPFDAFFKNLDYNGGPVMASNTNYAVYWRPPTGPAYPSDYQAGVNQYLTDLAKDSGAHENVDSVASQYNDATGAFANYNSHFGGALIDTDPYPANGCTQAPICLTDIQLQAELTKFVKAQGLPTDLAHEYLLLT